VINYKVVNIGVSSIYIYFPILRGLFQGCCSTCSQWLLL